MSTMQFGICCFLSGQSVIWCSKVDRS